MFVSTGNVFDIQNDSDKLALDCVLHKWCST